jgi:ABC-type Fe3+-siderophore transport system permease subunit
VNGAVSDRRPTGIIIAMALCLMVAILLRLCIQGSQQSGSSLLAWPTDAFTWNLRGTRVLLAIGVGAALGISGALLQTLLRNPLASPDVLGVSSGAGLAVVLSVVIVGTFTGPALTDAAIGSQISLGAAWLFIPAAIGGLVSLAILMFVGRLLGSSSTGVLLAGVVLSVLCGSAVVLLQQLFPAQLATGSIAGRSVLFGSLHEEVSLLMAAVFAGLVLIVTVLLTRSQSRWLNGLALSDDEAAALGLSPTSLRRVLIIAAGLLCAAAVAMAGPIGFVGLIAPHAAAGLLGRSRAWQHRWKLPLTAIMGALVMLLADIAVRAIHLPSGRLPLGILTTLIGGPMMLYLLWRSTWASDRSMNH